jgi:uncharacterized protein (DUF2225 family)
LPELLIYCIPKGFSDVTDAEISKLQELRSARWNAVNKFFGDIDFRNDRDLMLGAASYMLAVDCYNIRRKKYCSYF